MNTRTVLIISLIFTNLLFSLGCGRGGSATPTAPISTSPVELDFASLGANKGIFDPSVAQDPTTARLWMSYSLVTHSDLWPLQNDKISTRLAFSDDQGSSWTEGGLFLHEAQDVALPVAPPNNAGTWNHEVSSLVYDPGALPNERWKLFGHHYLWMNGTRMFEHGWISLKTAANPQGPWSAERKMFTGSLYNAVNDAIIGPPEYRLNVNFPQLADCLTFSEPGCWATANSLYLALLAATGSGNRIVLLKLTHASGNWELVGTLLTAADASHFGYDGFTAPEICQVNGTFYLIATPQTNGKYLGTFVFQIEELESATIARTDGYPDLVTAIYGADTTHNGAATYVASATGCGILYSEVFVTPPNVHFQIYKSQVNL